MAYTGAIVFWSTYIGDPAGPGGPVNGWFNGTAVAYSDVLGWIDPDDGKAYDHPELSVQPDGTFQKRKPGTAAANPGGFETCAWSGSYPALVYHPLGIPFPIQAHARP